MDDAAPCSHPLNVAFLKAACAVFHEAVQHEGDRFQPGVWVGFAEWPARCDLIVGHQEKGVSQRQVAWFDHQGRFVLIACEAGRKRRDRSYFVNLSVAHSREPRQERAWARRRALARIVDPVSLCPILR
ncbi:hypothetical protein D3C73_1076080 [compost metagenome]